MELVKHCLLCDNRDFDIQTGSTCSLTSQKPSFSSKCNDIAFEQAYEKVIVETNTDLFLVKRTKAKTITHVITFLVIGISVIALGYFFGTYMLDRGVISTIPLIIICLGFGAIIIAGRPANKYLQELKITERRKKDLDELLQLYNIAYDISFTAKEDILGNVKVSHDLHFTRKNYR